MLSPDSQKLTEMIFRSTQDYFIRVDNFNVITNTLKTNINLKNICQSRLTPSLKILCFVYEQAQEILLDMAKFVAPIELNEIQYGTLDELKNHADANGVVDNSIIALYKLNVISALERRGVIKVYRGKHYKITNLPIKLKRPPRLKRIMQEMIATKSP